MPMDADRLGAAMFDAVNALASGASESNVQARYKAMAQAIIDEIKDNADISPLLTTSTPAGAGPHIHNPLTVLATGKIS
jgi:hypothetical protein